MGELNISHARHVMEILLRVEGRVTQGAGMSKQWRWTRQPLCPHLVRSHVDAVLPRLGLGGDDIGGGQLDLVCGNGGGRVVVLTLLVVLLVILGPSPASVMVEGTGSDFADCPVPQTTARECNIATWREKVEQKKNL
jgi:hypothetical protein